jgi:uroporphyrinogen-III decarboxylase
MGGVYITLLSGLLEILGWEKLLLALAYPRDFDRVIEGYPDWVGQFYRAYARTSLPVLMCHDDICWTRGPVAAPQWYRSAYFPRLARLLAPWKEAGKKVIFTSDGDYTAFFDDLVRCGVDMFVMEPHTDMAAFARRYGRTHGFVGNADTRVLLLGGRDDIRREVERCFDIGRRCPGFVMAVGNHIPPNTPVDSALWYDECYRSLARR